MKKIVSLLLVVVMVVAFGAFNASADTVKVGLITLHDENSTYDNNFIVATTEACAKMGAELVVTSPMMAATSFLPTVSAMRTT